ncbi:MAG: phosphoribosylamine--glycine ligase, partial [Candidatus Ranarchaeia archaeon]
NKKNPGIDRLAKKTIIMDLSDFEKLKKLSKIDMAFIGPEAPLAEGISDYLEDKLNIPVIGPRKSVARIEWSKVCARELLDSNDIEGNPQYKVCRTKQDIQTFLDLEGVDVVVKPDVLTGGKGVRLFGDHLRNREDVETYALERMHSDGSVILEEKLVGSEFTLQAFVDGTHLKIMPLVRDFKRAYDGDKGPNTGSMGSYSCKDHTLPDIPLSATKVGQRIMKQTITALKTDYEPYKGILYGQFMYTDQGVRMIEFNSRFGDPEAMNVLSVLVNDLAQIGDRIADGNLVTPKFKGEATCCVYVVPEGYPVNPVADSPLKIEVSPNTDLYYAAVYEKDKIIYTTRSRALAVLGKGKSVAEARANAYSEIPKISGKINYRSDIAINV